MMFYKIGDCNIVLRNMHQIYSVISSFFPNEGENGLLIISVCAMHYSIFERLHKEMAYFFSVVMENGVMCEHCHKLYCVHTILRGSCDSHQCRKPIGGNA